VGSSPAGRANLLNAKSNTARIVAAIERVAANPRAPNNNMLPLTGVKNGFRLRLGDWRVSFTLEGDMMDVFEIAPRGGAHK